MDKLEQQRKEARSLAARILGRRGGRASVAGLTPEQLSERGKRAVAGREAKRAQRKAALQNAEISHNKGVSEMQNPESKPNQV